MCHQSGLQVSAGSGLIPRTLEAIFSAVRHEDLSASSMHPVSTNSFQRSSEVIGIADSLFC